MSTHKARRQKLRMIRAAAESHTITCEASAIEWVKASDGEQKTPSFSMLAYTGGPMNVGYYSDPVVIDLAGLTAKAPIPILLNHDFDRIVGHADVIDVGESTVKLSGIISGASPEAAQVQASSKLGFPWKASVGARPDKMEVLAEKQTATVNGKTVNGPCYIARKATLGEVSFVPIGADSKTTVKVAAIAAATTPKEIHKMNPFHDWLKAMGLDPATLTEEQTTKLQAKFDAEKAAPIQATATPEPVKVDPIADIRAEAARIAAIQKLCGSEFADIQATAISEGWSTSKTEVAVLKAQLPKAPAIHASTKDLPTETIEAALCMSAGLQNVEKAYKPEVIEAAQKNFRNLGLQEVLLMQARVNGYNGRERIHAGNIREVIKAAFSTHSLTTLLTTVGNKLTWDGFNSIEQRWSKVASTRSVSDFKAMTAYRMTSSLEYEELPPSGEIKHGTVGQETYSIQAKTYAKMASFSRQDIINDDLGTLDDLRNRLGLGAVGKMEKVFWTAWLAASNAGTFWTAARGNLVTSSALAEAGLNAAVKAFSDMKGPDGFRIGVKPKYVLVPTALEATAKKFYTSSEVRDTTATTKFATANIYAGAYEPISVPELGDSDYTGYSATSWFLLADPRVLASAAMCFLGGNQSPTIESAEADFDTLGIQFRGYHDFGVSMTEYLASVKATA